MSQKTLETLTGLLKKKWKASSKHDNLIKNKIIELTLQQDIYCELA